MSMLYQLLAITIDASQIDLPTAGRGNNATIESILTGIYIAIAGVGVFFIVRGALLYVTNGSDPSANKQARETIIYAVVAIAGSTMVFALVQFVLEVLS